MSIFGEKAKDELINGIDEFRRAAQFALGRGYSIKNSEKFLLQLTIEGQETYLSQRNALRKVVKPREEPADAKGEIPLFHT